MYKVVSLDKTSLEKDFNLEYHKKYIGMVGTQVEHNVKCPNTYKDFICLEFDLFNRDWFHKDDLEVVL